MGTHVNSTGTHGNEICTHVNDTGTHGNGMGIRVIDMCVYAVVLVHNPTTA
jgi:hypothetical protein